MKKKAIFKSLVIRIFGAEEIKRYWVGYGSRPMV
jgi:hypothetical protein